MGSSSASTQQQAPAGAGWFSGARKVLTLVACLLLFAHLPLLIEHFLNLWSRPHYQFVVFLPVVVWLLATQRLRDSDGKSSAKANAAERFPLLSADALVWCPLLLLSLTMLATATYLRSPWLDMVSALVTCLGFILAIGGRPLLGRLFPAFLVLCMAVPLPSNLDVRLITGLREITTQLSSVMLDELGVLHLVSGNVIELPGKPLFIADACTGIHSLFVLVTCALFVGLWARRRVLHVVLLLTATIGIVLVENVARVVGLAVALDHFGVDLTEGWRHTVFGFVLFAASLVFVVSTDQLLEFFWPTGLNMPVRGRRRWWQFWRWRKRNHEPSKKSVEKTHTTLNPTEWADVVLPRARRVLLPLAIGFAVLGVIQLAWMPTRAEQMKHLLQRHALDFPEFGEEAVPADLDGWQCAGFQVEERVQEDPMGNFSQQWTFERDGITVLLSLDYPYTRAHDLTSCYRATGWRIDDREIIEEAQTDSDSYAFARMSRPLHGGRLLFYSLYDTAGNCEIKFKEELGLGELLHKRVDYGRPWFQIQVLASGPTSFTPEQEEQVRSLFLHMRRVLHEKCFAAIGNGEGGEE